MVLNLNSASNLNYSALKVRLEALEADLRTVSIHSDGELTECSRLAVQHTSETVSLNLGDSNQRTIENELKEFLTELTCRFQIRLKVNT